MRRSAMWAVFLVASVAGASSLVPEARAATPPKIVSAKLLSPTTIDVAVAPGQPRLEIEFTTGPAGLNYIQYGFTSESGAQKTPVLTLPVGR